MNNIKYSMVLVIIFHSLIFVGCGKKSTIYEIDLLYTESYLPEKLYAQEDFVKYETDTVKVIKFLHLPIYYVGSWAYKNTVSHFYTKRYKDGEENFNSIQQGQRYNYIIDDDKFVFTKTGESLFRDYYSKHARLNEFEGYVRYAGEIWKVGDNQFEFNNASGSYKPKVAPGYQAEELLNRNFPHINFEFVPFFVGQ